jgi:type I restriction enzyme S subunit
VEWNIKRLSEVTEITRLAGYEYSTLWEDVEDGEIIALRGYNIGENEIIDKEISRITKKLSNRLIRSKLFIDDVVFPCVGTVGNAVSVKENDKYHINQNIAKITPGNKLDSDFLVYYLMSEHGRREIDKYNATSTQPNILVGSLRKFLIFVPKRKDEQEKNFYFYKKNY